MIRLQRCDSRPITSVRGSVRLPRPSPKNNDRRFIVNELHPPVLEVGKAVAVVRGPVANRLHDLADRLLDRFLFQNLGHLDQ